jgi:PAS domain S-box-containing protein
MIGEIQALYVDDEPDLLELGKAFLNRLGDFSVTTIPSASKALVLMKLQVFDVIISDYQMPVMNGIEFLKNVRNSGNFIPFILFTGKGREEVVIQALNEGADFYLQKGGDPRSQFAELAHKIRQAVRQRRLEASIRNLERRESDIISFLPDATFAIDTNGFVITWNQAMEKMSGISSSEMLGKGEYEYSRVFYNERRPMLIDLILHDDPDIRSRYPWIKQEGDRFSSEITLPHFHGGTGASFWFTASPLYDNQGMIVGAIESIREVTESKRAEEALRLDESRLEALLTLNLMIGEPESEIIHYALEEAVRLTQSEVGYIAFLNEGESVLTMHAWSEVAMEECQVREKSLVYPLDSTGLWGEPVRQRQPVVTNDYSAYNPLKKGIPKGHVHLTRHLGVPVFDGERIVAVVGVGNKHQKYSQSDIRQLELLIGGMWTIVQRKKAEITLLQKNEELQVAYEEIFSADEELRSNLDKLRDQSQELAENEHQFRAMASNIPGVVYRLVVQPDGRTEFTYISERCKEILGIDNELTTFSEEFNAHIDPEDREALLTSIQEAITKKTLWRFEGRYTRPSGDELWLKVVSNPVMEEGRFIFDGIIFDDTAWKRMDEFNRLLANMSDNVPASITIHDFDGNFLYANEETFRVHGYSREEFLSKNLHEIDMPESGHLIAERMRQLQVNGFLDFDVQHFHKNGTRIPLHVWVKLIDWDRKKVLLSVATDLTKHNQYDEVLHEANQKLRLLTSLTRHDLLNQLTVVKGCLVLALEESDPAIIQDCIARAKAAGDRVEQIIKFTKEYEEFGCLSNAWQRISPIIETVQNEVNPGNVIIDDKIPENLEVYVDFIIKKVFFNLLDNAIRHGEKVTIIRFSSYMELDDLIILCEDDGIGVPYDKKELIFEHGYGSHTGIGLFLSREALSITGLSIRECGEPETGARFEILVPNGKFRFNSPDISDLH